MSAPDVHVPVLIVGGGGCGLSSSIFLSDFGVPHLLIERHSGTSILPKAHYLNQRTMEIFRRHGVAEAIYDVGAPLERFGHVRWMTSLAGEGPLDRRELHEMDAFGAGTLRERYEADSPVAATNYPQLRLEPLLRREAEKRAPGAVRFHHELVGWQQEPAGVTATVLDRDTGQTFGVHARYVLAADGGKTFGPEMGVTMQGPTGIIDMVSVHFAADLSQYWDDRTMITFFMNPEGQSSWGSGSLIQAGPTWGRRSEEWIAHFAFRTDDPERFNETAIVPRLRELLRVPDLQPQVHQISHWILDRVIADRWRIGDVFLAGDAAHRQPPSTGLGLNAGIQDADNLTWKLAQVLSGAAADSLLDSYETERKPVCTDGADWALMSFQAKLVADAGIGLHPDAPLAANTAAFHALFAEGLLGEALRARVRECIDLQRCEFQHHDVELGYRYRRGALIEDGTEPPSRSDKGTAYTPTTRPGHRLPHAWLDHGDTLVSTHDLVGGSADFALITGRDGAAWSAAAGVASDKLGITINIAQLGADYSDPDGAWGSLCQIDSEGAILVRPDNFVAWRCATRTEHPELALTSALAAVLGSG